MSEVPATPVTNATSAHAYVYATVSGPVGTALYVLNALLSITLNTIVLIVIHHQRELQEYMRVLFQALTITDLCLGIVWSSWSAMFYFYHNPKTCSVMSKVFPFVERVQILTIMALLCGISFNLYLLITRPLRYHIIVTKRRFFTLLVSTLIVVVFLSGIYLPIPRFPFSMFTNLLIERCLTRNQSMRESSLSYVYALNRIIPICITLVFTLVIYIKLLVIAYRKSRAVAHLKLRKRAMAVDVELRVNVIGDRHQPPAHPPQVNADELREQLEHRKYAGLYKRFKGIITVLLLWGSFCVVWIPTIIHRSSTVSPILLDMISGMNTWIQPIVYLLTNEEARNLCWEYVQRRIIRRS